MYLRVLHRITQQSLFFDYFIIKVLLYLQDIVEML